MNEKSGQVVEETHDDVARARVVCLCVECKYPSPQASATRALAAGTTLNKVIALLKKTSPTIKAPIVLFTYYNPIYQKGFEVFVKEIVDAGAKGLLVPDIPLEETPKLAEICKKNGIDLVLLSTPTTPVERMAKIAEASAGFIYLVSVTGVTGMRTDVESRVEVGASIKKVREKVTHLERHLSN